MINFKEWVYRIQLKHGQTSASFISFIVTSNNITVFSHVTVIKYYYYYYILLSVCQGLVKWWHPTKSPNGERMRKWRKIHSLNFLIFSLFPPALSISYIKNCQILSQNVKYGTFVANVTKNLRYALWENNSGSNLLRESSASCAGLPTTTKYQTLLLYTDPAPPSMKSFLHVEVQNFW